ncbi:hypothetical protein HME9302_02420 [Alteripontixanthobacter maritimus]|uniref:Lipoprotein n=1 Tax=Alteripontixanthobacter maritimus TaxID=2161824 RepID=A0A369Q8I7_9SPHN|nr:hypothetical protein [Alteripontixanthobacter maritimus]RDC61201.1 hypothetical protein HME9302_02420 [Alteripontixanthobacter maritimus]
MIIIQVKRGIALCAIPLLAACASTSPAGPRGTDAAGIPPVNQRAVAVPRTQPVAPPTFGFRAPKVMNVPGLEGVIGQTAIGLVGLFGPARLDVREGDVRKLQFAGQACVLDIYLYPVTSGATPTATFVDARRSSDGLDVDRTSCAEALKRR